MALLCRQVPPGIVHPTPLQAGLQGGLGPESYLCKPSINLS